MHIPNQERERLRRLYALKILDTPPEPAFDQLAMLAAEMLDAPIAFISILDQDRQWFKARVGLDVLQTPRNISFCQHTLYSQETLIIPDAQSDPRFSHNPQVTGSPNIRFYAGIPIRPDGQHIIGTLSVIDTKPRQLTEQQLRHLEMLALQVSELLRLRQQAIHNAQHPITTSGPDASGELLAMFDTGPAGPDALESGSRLWHFLKFTLLRLTDSEHALIGEVQRNSKGEPVLRIHAASDHNPRAVFRFRSQKPCQRTAHNKEACLLEQVFIEGKTVICNSFERGSSCHRCLPNTPSLRNYVGVPVIDQGEIIGMFAIANSPRPYDAGLIEWLASFRATCALLIRLHRQLNERDNITVQLRQARDEAERANLAKSDFLSSMSHELRTPLNAILGFAQLLLANTRQPLSDRQQRQVEQIQRSGQHLLDLISEILDLSCIESGYMKLDIQPVSMGSALHDALTQMAPIAEKAGIQLISPPALDNHIRVHADPMRLQQILLNLIGNAIKYNRQEGTVHISTQMLEKRLRINIKDTGIGIPVSRLTQLFQPFSRLGAENSAIEGTGVGLALTRRLLESMNGYIGVDSCEGVGSTFWFELTLAQKKSSSLLPEKNIYLEDFNQNLLQPLHILYVEDDPANRALLEDFFSEHEHFVLHCANTGHQGFEMASRLPINIILMDINLPDMNGRQVRASLAESTKTRHIPVIAISASAMPTDIQRGAEAGFSAYLTKPFALNQLPTLLRQLATQEPVLNDFCCL